MKSIYFTFGRFQPPTVGHEKLLTKLREDAIADNAEHCVFCSQSTDTDKNPLSYNDKIQFMREFFPDNNIAAFQINPVSPYAVAKFLSDSGYKNVKMYVGEDRVNEFKNIAKYIKHPDPTKCYNFESFDVVSGGKRLNEGDDIIASASGTLVRNLIKNNKLEEFYQYIPGANLDLKKKLFYKLRETYNINEAQHIRKMLDSL
jgi:hypothetical protein